MFSKAVILSLLLTAAFAAVSYDGHQLWRVTVSKHRIAGINAIVDKMGLDVWASGSNWVDFQVHPKDQSFLGTALKMKNYPYTVQINDIGAIISSQKSSPRAFSLTDYNTWTDIESYLADVTATSNMATLASIGQTVEGREMWQVRISTGPGKQDIWIDCGIHAREWITPAVCLWGIDLLTTQYGVDPDITTLLDTYDVLILPVDNPDGYDYTWTSDRMWRKNRNQYPDDLCAGIDLNRNFDDHFGGDGTSANSCAETYKGPSPASEMETQNNQNAILSRAAETAALFSIHSYSQLWMYAFGWTPALPPENAELNAVSKVGVDALTAVFGTQYEYGPISTTIYPAASTTVDYGYAVGIVHSYTLELRDTGNFGFLLPAAQIPDTATETWIGLIAAILSI